MIRLFQFKNNFLSQNARMVSAEYSSIGYFDGLDTRIVLDQEAQDILSLPTQVQYQSDDNCDYYNIVGIRREEDECFWKEKEGTFLFISCLRFKKCSEKLDEIVAQIENKYCACCYYTFDSSDLVVCMKSDSYIKAYQAIEKYPDLIAECDPGNGIQKSFSILSVRQEILDMLPEEDNNMEDEEVSVILRCVIKDRTAVKDFKEQLDKEVGIAESKKYGILGSDDMLIVLESVNIKHLFKQYKQNGLLTHSNRLYKKAFYNIRTEILV